MLHPKEREDTVMSKQNFTPCPFCGLELDFRAYTKHIEDNHTYLNTSRDPEPPQDRECTCCRHVMKNRQRGIYSLEHNKPEDCASCFPCHPSLKSKPEQSQDTPKECLHCKAEPGKAILVEDMQNPHCIECGRDLLKPKEDTTLEEEIEAIINRLTNWASVDYYSPDKDEEIYDDEKAIKDLVSLFSEHNKKNLQELREEIGRLSVYQISPSDHTESRYYLFRDDVLKLTESKELK